MSAEAKNLQRITEAIKKHNTNCEFPAAAVTMNPHEIERLGWDTIQGIPIQPDPNLGTGSFRIVCSGVRPPEDEVIETEVTLVTVQ